VQRNQRSYTLRDKVCSLVFLVCILAWNLVEAESAPLRLDIFIKSLSDLGYRVTEPLEIFHLVHPDWKAIQLEAKSIVGIKSTYPASFNSPLYFRFTITEEMFANYLAAENRLTTLQTTPSDVHSSERKSYPLRQAFRIDRTVYTVITDVGMFHTTAVHLTRYMQRFLMAETEEARNRILQEMRTKSCERLIVAAVQRELLTKEAYRGTVDGKWGPRTQEAVRAFQKANGLDQTERLDATLLQLLSIEPDQIEHYNRLANK